MINVLHLIYYAGNGSSEKYILSLAEKLHNNTCKFHLGYAVEGPLIEKIRALGVKVIHFPMKSPYDAIAAVRLKTLCKEHSIDIVHTHFLRENYVSVMSKLMGNKVTTIHTGHLLVRNNLLLRLSNSLSALLNDRVIAVSNSVKDRMTAGGMGAKRIEVIYKGIDSTYWQGRRSCMVRREFGIDREDFVVVSVARFSEEKGHMFFLEAIKQFTKLYYQHKDMRDVKVWFLLVGEGELLEHCRNLARMMGIGDRIIFTGYRDDIKSILHSCDLFVCHAKHEGLGVSILEALSAGLPVIATRSGGPVEIIKEQNSCGSLVEFDDVEGLADEMIRFVTDKELYKRCSENSCNAVRGRFDLENMVDRTYSFYIQSLKAGYG